VLYGHNLIRVVDSVELPIEMKRSHTFEAFAKQMREVNA
jgi:hypothetical protein